MNFEGKKLGFNNTCLISRQISTIKSRDELHILQNFCGDKYNPFIASPMKDVVNLTVAKILEENKCIGILHRFQSIEDQYFESIKLDNPFCAIGINGDYIDRFKALFSGKVTNFCIDVANSSSINVKNAVKEILEISDDINIIVGNVMSKEGIEFWNDIPQVVGLRIATSTGAGCSTFNATAMIHPPISLLLECRPETSKFLIVDGGIKEPKDACLAIAAGADFVMMGSNFAKCKESPAKKVQLGQKVYKSYSGSASFEVQKLYKESPRYIEGKSILLDYSEESINGLLSYFQDGLKSSMSYANAKNIQEFRQNVSICEV